MRDQCHVPFFSQTLKLPDLNSICQALASQWPWHSYLFNVVDIPQTLRADKQTARTALDIMPQYCISELASVSHFIISTHGSSLVKDEVRQASYALCIFAIIDGLIGFVASSGGKVSNEPGNGYVGGCRTQLAHDGEYSATVYALLWIVAHGCHFCKSFTILSDALLTLRCAEGSHRWRSHPDQQTLLRSLAHFVGSFTNI